MKARLIFACVAALLFAGPAVSRPPPPGSEDEQIMAPYAEWIRDVRTGTGALCCSIADGRPANMRERDGHWQAYIDRVHYDDAPNEWVDVPEEAIVRIPNPTGFTIVWWYQHRIRCVVFASGT